MTRNHVPSLFKIYPPEGEPFELAVRGRIAWMLDKLLEAQTEGFTSKDAPGARVSDYVRRLRVAGVPIETVRIEHGGPFPGTHGKYVLKAKVVPVDPAAKSGAVCHE
jgi:hypothetical protein